MACPMNRPSGILIKFIPDFGDPTDFAGLFLLKDIDKIVGHFFLSDDDFFASLDDEVATLVEFALTSTNALLGVHAIEGAVKALNHGGDTAELEVSGKFIGLDFFFFGFIIDLDDFFSDI